MPSRSALMAAAARAAHLEVDRPPFLFEDTMARRLLGEQAEGLLSYHHKSGSHPVLLGTRLAVTTRARFAEDRLAAAASTGVSQYVILGAGLDSFAVRSNPRPRARHLRGRRARDLRLEERRPARGRPRNPCESAPGRGRPGPRSVDRAPS